MEELDNKMERLYSKYQKEFKSFKSQIIDILEYCLFNDKKELNDLSPLEKLHIFVNTKNVEEYQILKYNEFNKVIKINKNTSKITEKELIRSIKDKDNNRYDLKRLCCLEKKMMKQRRRCGDNAAMKLL